MPRQIVLKCMFQYFYALGHAVYVILDGMYLYMCDVNSGDMG